MRKTLASFIDVRTGRAGRVQARPVIFHGPKRPMPLIYLNYKIQF
jgi:hypothetical protein